MKRHRHRFYRLLAQYNRYRRKLSRIEQGISYYKRKEMLVKRLRRLQERLLIMKEMGKMAGLSAAMSAGLIIGSPGVSQCQNLNLKTDNVLGLAHIEDSAKPAFADFDGDGDLDLFIGGKISTLPEVSSVGISYFRNENGRLTQAVSPFPADLGTGEALVDTARISPAFIDIDDDGDLDAFAGLSNGTVLFYRNTDGALALVQGAENPFDGIRVGDSNNASPTFVDLDGDGDLDAVFGKYSGGLSWYANDGGVFTDETGGPSDPFTDINASESSVPAFVDWDGDGDIDLFVGNKTGEVAYFENIDGIYTAADAATNPFSGLSFGENTAPTFADIDGDGDMDAFVGQGDGDVIYLRNDEGSLVPVERNSIGIGYSDASLSHAFVDLDGDNDLDITSGGFEGILHAWENNGGTFSLLPSSPVDSQFVRVEYLATPSWADIDADGDMDLFVGSGSLYYSPAIAYYQNDANAFTLMTGEADPFNGIDAGDNENIAFIDADGDGDLDAYIGNKDGAVRYFVNNDGAFAEAAADNPFTDVSFMVDSWPNHPVKPAFADIDGDGDMDAYFGLIDGNIRVFENMGDAGRGVDTYVELEGEANPFAGMDFGRSAAPTFGDVDGDGDDDLVVGNAVGHTYYFENSNTVSAKDYSYSPETKAFPNPTLANIRLEMPWSKKTTDIRVYSAAGQLLQHLRTKDQRADISLQSYAPGFYIIKLTGAEGAAAKKVWKH